MSASSADLLHLRLATAADEPFLLTMLFYAAHAHDEPGATPEHVRANPSLARYVVGYGAPGDLGIVAEDGPGGTPLGAAWVRILAGENRAYGWVDDAIPELAIAVAPEVTGRGIGGRMLEELLSASTRALPRRIAERSARQRGAASLLADRVHGGAGSDEPGRRSVRHDGAALRRVALRGLGARRLKSRFVIFDHEPLI